MHLAALYLHSNGIIIALSTAANLLGPFVENLFKASDASKQTAENAKKLKDSISGIFEGSAKEATEVLSLIAVLKSETETRERKLAAIQELNKIAPETFNNLKLEGNAVRNLDADYQTYLASLKTVIAAKIKQAQLEQLVSELLRKQGTTATGFDATIAAANKSLDENIAKKIKAGQELNSLETLRLEQSKKEQEDLKKLNDQINSLFADLQQLSKGVKLDIKTDTAKQGLTELQKRLIDIAELAQKVFNIPLKLRFDTGDLDVDKFRKAQEILKGIQDHTIRLRIIVPDKIEVPKLQPEIDKPFLNQQIKDFAKGLTVELDAKLIPKTLLEQLDDLKRKLSDSFAFDPKNISQSLQEVSKLILSDKELQDALKLSLTLDTDPTKFAVSINEIKQFLPKELVATLDIALEVGDIKTIGLEQSIANMNENINKAINDALKNISTEGFASIGEAIGTALAGGNVSDVFKKFGETLGSAVEALGKQIIALGVAALLAQKALATLFTPAGAPLAIAAGIALVAIGEALKQLLGGGLQGFEKGGRPPVNDWVIVGEDGPEIMKFDRPGRIYSNSESRQMMSSVSSSSVKDHETIREYIIANRVSQTVKEYFNTSFTERIKEGIRLSLAPIETKISDSVRSMTANNEKLTAYTYRLHEQSSQTIEKIALLTDRQSSETFKHSFDRLHEVVSNNFTSTNNSSTASYKQFYQSVSSIIEKIIPYAKPSDNITSKETVATIVKGDNESSHYENSLERITASLKDHSASFKELHSTSTKAIDRLHESVTNNLTSSIDKLHETINTSDRSVTIERIINNNFFSSDSFKETFKSMSLTDLQKTFHIPAFAQGGAVFGPTLAILGEGFGISRGNPEFVGTRSQLSGIQGGQFDVNVNVDGELSFDMGKLAIALNRNQRSSGF